MQLVLLKLLDSRIEATYTSEHFVMLLLESLHLFACVHDGLVQLCYFKHGLLVGFLGFIQMLFHVSSGCDGLNGKSLLSFQLIFEIVSFTDELVMLLHSHSHFFHSLVLLYLALFSENSFCSEHGRKQLGVLTNFFKFLGNLLLEFTSIFKFWNVEVLIFVVLILCLSKL